MPADAATQRPTVGSKDLAVEPLGGGVAVVEKGMHEIRAAAISLAEELVTVAPLAVQSIRGTLRSGLAADVARSTEHERSEQAWLRGTKDFAEGVRASTESRKPVFTAQ